MFGAYGKVLPQSCMSFVSKAAAQSDIACRLGLERKVLPVCHTRQISKSDMVLNTATPRIDVDAESFEVAVNGVKISLEPAKSVALGQLYWFS
jgi:urease subunit alpha